MISIKDECLVDSGTTNTILKDKKYFSQLSPAETHVNIISGISNLIEGSERVCIFLPKGTKLIINDALYFSKFRRNLLF
jgi:hypothetical protein